VIPVARKNINHTGPMKDELKLMNHLVLNIQTHTTDNGAIRIVGFEVEAFSVDWGDSPCQGSDDLTSKGHQLYNKDSKVSYTYQVHFEPIDLLWAHRFDHFMKLKNSHVNHIQILLAFFLALGLTFIVYRIFERTLSKDLARVN